MRKIFFLAGWLLFAACGCGSGGGSGNGAMPPPTVTPVSAATRLRTLQAGDSWTYQMTGTAVLAGQTTPLGGVRSIQVEQANVGGTPMLLLHDVTQVLYPDGHNYTTTQNIYFTQESSTGNLVEQALQTDNGAIVSATTPGVFWPGAWAANASTVSTTRLANGISTYRSVNINSRGVALTTVLGERACWTAFVTMVSNAGSVSSTDAFDPALGSFVSEQFPLTDPQGNLLHLSADIAATSVAL